MVFVAAQAKDIGLGLTVAHAKNLHDRMFLMTPGLQPILHDVAENKPCKFPIESGCCTHGLL